MTTPDTTKSETQSQAETIDFGFREVARADKQGLVRGVFDAVADKYDVMVRRFLHRNKKG